MIDHESIRTALSAAGARWDIDVPEPSLVDGLPPDRVIARLARAAGLAIRPIALTGDWQRSASLPLVAFTATEHADPQDASASAVAVALLPTARGYRVQGPRDSRPRHLGAAEKLQSPAYEVFPPLGPGALITLRQVIGLALTGTGRLRTLVLGLGLAIASLGMLVPVVTQTIVDAAIPLQERALLTTLGMILVGAAVLASVLTWVQARTMSRLAQEVSWRMQPSFLARLLAMPPRFYRRFSSGDLTNRILAVNGFQSLMSAQVLTAGVSAVFSFVYVVMMLVIDVWLGLAALGVIVASATILIFGIRQAARQSAHALEESRRANGWLVQCLHGIGKVRLAGAEERLHAQYLGHVVRQAEATRRQGRITGRISAWFAFATALAPAAFFIIVGVTWAGGAVSTGRYLAFASAFGLSFTALIGVSSLASTLANARPTLEMLRPVFQERPTNSPHLKAPAPATGEVEFAKVHFRYSEQAPWTLQDVSLHVHPGETVALVGASGSGKSTLVRLLLAFETPDSGQVLIDGQDLAELDATLVRASMGVVLQTGRLTRGSVLDNIVGPGVDDSELAWHAASIAAIADDIRDMPMQMQTIVDPWNVSGGQAQRILLARAVAMDPRILVLDEATSSLDASTQKRVVDGLSRLQGSRLVIAHRLITVQDADRIVVLQDGRIVEEGTFEALLHAGGAFSALVTRQARDRT